MKDIVILGSTGSIGLSTLGVVERHPEKLRVVGLSAGRNIKLLMQQVAHFQPSCVAIRDAAFLGEIKTVYPTLKVFVGEDAAEEMLRNTRASMVVAAISGMAGLKPVLAAVEQGMHVALANKEALVAAGELLLQKVAVAGVSLLPVDSEHSAIWQALHGWKRTQVRRLILTASGGPFFGRNKADLVSVTRDEALAHPTWKMGGKISIDSATLMNKGLEVIEAHHLFQVPYDCIEVLVHPQSIVHSLVEYVDGSQLAQLSQPDMRIPIQLALSYPERWESEYVRNDYNSMQWSFHRPDLDTFPCLSLAIQAGLKGGLYPAILNAANEKAVEAFLAGHISFASIAAVVEDVLSSNYAGSLVSLDDVLAADGWARLRALDSLKRRAV